ncbi:hypothetical protein [Micromonospora sp. M71_S20]|uniref:hypothetical protein n=1 Tax=Micromonospora sp. M71_S20 TaxID=592872 RepID=UPI0011E5AA40|nr:hypothetical protein [Micromonospora sp. M71_S20]
MTTDYVRHGTTNLFAGWTWSIDQAQRTAATRGCCASGIPSTEQAPTQLELHIMLGSYATHMTPATRQGLIEHTVSPALHPELLVRGSTLVELVPRTNLPQTTSVGLPQSRRPESRCNRLDRGMECRLKPPTWTEPADAILETTLAPYQRINNCRQKARSN